MGRTKGSKNGIRKIPIRKRIRYEDRYETVMERRLTRETSQVQETLPVFDSKVLRAYRNRKYEKCIKLIDRILDINTDDNKDHYKILMAASYTMLGQNFDIAHLILDEVLESDPLNSFAMYGKGVAFYFERKINESVIMLDKAIATNPGEEMERAKNMKMRIDLERRKAVIMIEKMEKDELVTNNELPECLEKMIEDYDVTVDEEFTDLDLLEPEPVLETVEELAKTSDVETLNGFAELESPNDEDTTTVYSNDEQEDVTDDDSHETFKTPEKSNTGFSKLQTDIEKAKIIPDIPECLPKSFVPSTAEEFYAKGIELYTNGCLKKAVDAFGKSLELNPSYTEAEDMETKAKVLLDLFEVIDMNMKPKNYDAVVEILNEALEVDEDNDYVNRQFYYQRGLAYFHLVMNEKSLKDYAEFERLNKILLE